MNIVTSATIFGDAVGTRISITYSEVDDQGKIIRDNVRIDRVITDKSAKDTAGALMEYAQSLIDAE